MRVLIFILFLFPILFSACKKEEEPIPVITDPLTLTKNKVQAHIMAGYHFDDFSSGQAIDYSNYKRHGDPTGLSLVDGKYDKAVLFDNEYDNIKTDWGIGKFDKGITIDFWITNYKSYDGAAYHTLIEESSTGNNLTYGIRIDSSSRPYIEFYKNSQTFPGVMSTISLQEGTWYHIAFVYNGTDTKIYVNGELNNTQALLLGTVESWNTITIGDSWYGPGFLGILDELRFCNYAFTADEVKLLKDFK